MRLFWKSAKEKSGMPPGALVYTGDGESGPTRVEALVYDRDVCEIRTVEGDLSELTRSRETPGVTWIRVIGLRQVERVKQVGEAFSLHPLVLEDILHTHQRPKLEDYEDYLYFVFHVYRFDGERESVREEQVSLVLAGDTVLSFFDGEPEVFAPVVERTRKEKGRLRRMGADFLFYTLIDTGVDSCLAPIEKLGDAIEALEDEILEAPTPESAQRLQHLRRQVMGMRRSNGPLREAIARLCRSDTPLMKEGTGLYLRDVQDHIDHVLETLDLFRDMLTGMLDIYLSAISNRMNEVMKLLTLLAALFIPVTFIAGVYGMNFEHMPELRTRWGYPAVLTLMGVVIAGMLLFFRRKGWV